MSTPEHGLKERLFTFGGGSPATVKCENCGWKTKGHGDSQKVFDRSNNHECPGVESSAAYQARDARDLEAWRQANRTEATR